SCSTTTRTRPRARTRTDPRTPRPWRRRSSGSRRSSVRSSSRDCSGAAHAPCSGSAEGPRANDGRATLPRRRRAGPEAATGSDALPGNGPDAVVKAVPMEKIAVLGLGYVGLPVALAFARKYPGTVGFDVDEEK